MRGRAVLLVVLGTAVCASMAFADDEPDCQWSRDDGDNWCTNDPDPDEWTCIEEHRGPSYTRPFTAAYSGTVLGTSCQNGECCAFDRDSASWNFNYTHTYEVTIYWGHNWVNMGVMTLYHEYEHASIRDECTQLWGWPNTWFHTDCTEGETAPEPLNYGCPEGFTPM